MTPKKTESTRCARGMHLNPYHGGESHDFRRLKMADTYQDPSIQVRLSLIFSLILIRLPWGLKQIPRKNDIKMSILATFRQRSS